MRLEEKKQARRIGQANHKVKLHERPEIGNQSLRGRDFLREESIPKDLRGCAEGWKKLMSSQSKKISCFLCWRRHQFSLHPIEIEDGSWARTKPKCLWIVTFHILTMMNRTSIRGVDGFVVVDGVRVGIKGNLQMDMIDLLCVLIYWTLIKFYRDYSWPGATSIQPLDMGLRVSVFMCFSFLLFRGSHYS